MREPDLDHALKAALAAVEECRPDLHAGWGCSAIIHQKSDMAHDVVTQLDGQTERRLGDALAKFDDGIGFVGEEYGGDTTSDAYWLVDPIDGTGHFSRGTPGCTCMVSLVVGGEVQVSVVDDFVHDEVFSARRGGGATCNGEAICVGTRTLRESYLCAEIDVRRPGNAELFVRLHEETSVLNPYAAGYAFAQVAAGRWDGRVTKDPAGYDWDFAPGLLVGEAGGILRNFNSDTYVFGGQNDFVAVAASIHDELSAVIQA